MVAPPSTSSSETTSSNNGYGGSFCRGAAHLWSADQCAQISVPSRLSVQKPSAPIVSCFLCSLPHGSRRFFSPRLENMNRIRIFKLDYSLTLQSEYPLLFKVLFEHFSGSLVEICSTASYRPRLFIVSSAPVPAMIQQSVQVAAAESSASSSAERTAAIETEPLPSLPTPPACVQAWKLIAVEDLLVVDLIKAVHRSDQQNQRQRQLVEELEKRVTTLNLSLGASIQKQKQLLIERLERDLRYAREQTEQARQRAGDSKQRLKEESEQRQRSLDAVNDLQQLHDTEAASWAEERQRLTRRIEDLQKEIKEVVLLKQTMMATMQAAAQRNASPAQVRPPAPAAAVSSNGF